MAYLMKPGHAVGKEVCEILGIKCDGVTELTLTLNIKADSIPTVRIDRVLFAEECKRIFELFELGRKIDGGDEEPFVVQQ